VGLLKNLHLLLGESLLTRMTELERRQELLEDYTEQKLDSMRAYSARVGKRRRDAAERVATDVPSEVDPRVASILRRRARRNGLASV